MSTDANPQNPTDDLAKFAETTEARYREVIAALARGETVDQDELLRVASATGRNLATVRTHRDRLAARFKAAEQLKDEAAITQRVREAQASAEQAQEKLERAREKATKIVANATEACEHAKADHGAAFSEMQGTLDSARHTLETTADPEIDREAAELRKGLGLEQLEASKGHNPGIRSKVAKKEAASQSLTERKLHPTDGMNWT